ncbi:VOC family protein [Dyella sp. A6]|uniref:VOC family protein n=1 Tax=Dyella aluminiiresistens TaxID=3069105 RepID=UPI002E79C331|nr:VOC family protein [Dyella sp. A6]
MHHSRLCALVLDSQVDDLAEGARFWSAALGKPVVTAGPDDDGRYAELKTAEDEPIILLQKVGHESRVHLDIESDDIDAEADRLQALGARRVAFVRGRWWVMQAPTGHHFCVVHKQRDSFGTHLNRWDCG